MTNLNLLRDILAYGEGYSDEMMELFKSALEEITDLRERVLAQGGFSPTDTANLITGCGKSVQNLVHFESSGNTALHPTASMRITLGHTVKGMLLEQDVLLSLQNGQWAAQLVIVDFPTFNTPLLAMNKLAEWLMRLGLACQAGNKLSATMGALWKKD